MGENIYWKGNGKHRAYYAALEAMLPDRGPVLKNPKLENFRKARNLYNRLYNGLLVNKWDEFSEVYTNIHPGHYIYRGMFLQSLYVIVEERLNDFVLAAATEQGLIGKIENI